MTIIELFIYILLIHFLADFALQTHEQATKKATYPAQLTAHVGVYSLTWLVASWFVLGDPWQVSVFTLITFVTHWITDLITSNISGYYFKNDDYHNGFVVVGADQALHYIQLLFTFKFVSNLDPINIFSII